MLMDSLKMLRTVGKSYGKQKDVSHSFNPLFQPDHNDHHPRKFGHRGIQQDAPPALMLLIYSSKRLQFRPLLTDYYSGCGGRAKRYPCKTKGRTGSPVAA